VCAYVCVRACVFVCFLLISLSRLPHREKRAYLGRGGGGERDKEIV